MSSHDPSFTVRDVLRQTFALIRANTSMLLGTALLCTLPGFVGAVFIEPFLTPTPVYMFEPERDGVLGSVWAYRLYVALSSVLTSVLRATTLAVGASVAVASHRGQPTSARTIMRRVRARIVPLSGLGVLTSLAGFLGTICFVLPGLYLQVLFALGPAVCVTEFAGPMTSLERSAALTDGHRPRVLGLFTVLMIPRLVLVALIVAFAYYIFLGMEGASFLMALSVVTREPSGWGGALLVFLADMFYVLLGGVGLGVVYARAARIPVASTVDASIETFA